MAKRNIFGFPIIGYNYVSRHDQKFPVNFAGGLLTLGKGFTIEQECGSLDQCAVAVMTAGTDE